MGRRRKLGTVLWVLWVAFGAGLRLERAETVTAAVSDPREHLTRVRAGNKEHARLAWLEVEQPVRAGQVDKAVPPSADDLANPIIFAALGHAHASELMPLPRAPRRRSPIFAP